MAFLDWVLISNPTPSCMVCPGSPLIQIYRTEVMLYPPQVKILSQLWLTTAIVGLIFAATLAHTSSASPNSDSRRCPNPAFQAKIHPRSDSEEVTPLLPKDPVKLYYIGPEEDLEALQALFTVTVPIFKIRRNKSPEEISEHADLKLKRQATK